MQGPSPTLFVLDSAPETLANAAWLAGELGIPYEVFASAEEFLDRYDPAWTGCLLAELHVPGIGGLELLRRLNTCGNTLPAILVSAALDVPTAVQAMQLGAFTVLAASMQGVPLADAVRGALQFDRQQQQERSRRDQLRQRIRLLTPRERKVVESVMTGKPSPVIAEQLNATREEVSRLWSEACQTLGVDSAADLAVLAIHMQTRIYARDTGSYFPISRPHVVCGGAFATSDAGAGRNALSDDDGI